MTYLNLEIGGYELAYLPSSLVWQAPIDLTEQRMISRASSTVFFGGQFSDVVTFDGWADSAQMVQLMAIRDLKRIVTCKGDLFKQYYTTTGTVYVVVEDIVVNEQAGYTDDITRYYPYKFRVRKVGDADHQKRCTKGTLTLNPHTFSFTAKPVIILPTGIPDSYTKLLLHFDGDDAAVSGVGFRDVSQSSHGYATVGGTAQLDTGSFMLGTASLQLDGNSDYISFAAHVDFNLTSGDWTMECGGELDSLPGAGNYVTLASQYDDDNNRWEWSIWNDSGTYKIALVVKNGGVSILNYSEEVTITTAAFYRFAASRSGSTVYLFQDGTKLGSTTISGSFPTCTGDFQIGRWGTSQYWPGRIDEFRWTKGLARYTDDYTVSTVPFDAFQGATGIRTGEYGTIPYIANYDGNTVAYDVDDDDLGKNDVTIYHIGNEIGMKNGLLKIQSRNDETTYKGDWDVYYYNGSTWVAAGRLNIQAYYTSWEDLGSQYCTVDSSVDSDSECGAILGIWNGTSSGVTLLAEIQLERGKPFVTVRPTNVGVPTLTGLHARIVGTSSRYYQRLGLAVQDATAGAYGTETELATADDLNYNYIMDTAAIGVGSIVIGIITRTKANDRYYEAVDGGSTFTSVGQKFSTSSTGVTQGNDMEQFAVIVRKYEDTNDNPEELGKEWLAGIDQNQDLVDYV